MDNNSNSCNCSCCGHHSAGKKVLVIILCVLFAVLILYILVGMANAIKEGKYIGKMPGDVETISVSGEGEVYIAPDLGIVDFSVVSESSTVAAATADNTAKMNKVADFIKSKGVEAKDIKTTNYNISPRYEYARESGKRSLVGYEVSQSLQVKIRKLETAGSLIEGASAAGANEIGDLRFTVDNDEAVKNQARSQAINKAKSKAAQVAKEIGITLGSIVDFDESGEYNPVYNNYDVAEKSVGGGTAAAPIAPDIQTGQNKITITITLTYEIL